MRLLSQYNNQQQPRNRGQGLFVPHFQPVRETAEPGPIGAGEVRATSPFYLLPFNTFVPSEPSTGVPAELEVEGMAPTATVPETPNPNPLPARELYSGLQNLWDPAAWAEEAGSVTHARHSLQPPNTSHFTQPTHFPSSSFDNAGGDIQHHHHQSAPPSFTFSSAPYPPPHIGNVPPRRQLFPQPALGQPNFSSPSVGSPFERSMNQNVSPSPARTGRLQASIATGRDPDTLGGVPLQHGSGPSLHQRFGYNSQSMSGHIPHQNLGHSSQHMSAPDSQKTSTPLSLHLSAPVFRPASMVYGQGPHQHGTAPTSGNTFVGPFPARGTANQAEVGPIGSSQGNASAFSHGSTAQTGSFERSLPQASASVSSTAAAAAAAPGGQQSSALTEDQKRSRAQRLAEFIKAGGLELPGVEVPSDLADCVVPSGPPTFPESQPFNNRPAPTGVGQPFPPQPSAVNRNNNNFLGAPARVNDALAERWWAHGVSGWPELAQNMVFAETARDFKPLNFGVIKITDVPYNVTKEEILQLVGERAAVVQKPLGNKSAGIHIIMERSTAKSMDCFVEFDTPRDAEYTFNRLDAATGRRMIQNRRIEISVTSQEALMKELFPRAKCVTWHGPNPVIHAPADSSSAGFNGFVTNEEMVMTLKYGQSPQRSRFALKHQQRPFESMISLLLKYPWHEVWQYTLGERELIFKTTREMIFALAQKLAREEPRPNLDQKLLDDFLQCALLCPGFTEKQRAQLIDSTNGLTYPRVYVSPIAHEWPFDILNRRPDVSVGALMYVVDLLKRGTTPLISSDTSLAQASAMRTRTGPFDSPNNHFGNFAVPYPLDKGKMHIGAVALLEWQTVEDVLRMMVEK